MSTAALLIALVLSGTLPAAADDARDEAFLQRVRTVYSGVRSLHATFTQTNQWDLIDPAVPYVGEISVLADGRVELRYLDPEGHRLVGDGQWLWTYVPESGQVVKTPMGKQGAAVSRLFLNFLAGQRVTALAWGEDQVTVQLEPEIDLGLRELEVVIDRESGLGREFAWTDLEGNVSRYRLQNPQTNVSLDPERFVFHPPEGVDVVEISG